MKSSAGSGFSYPRAVPVRQGCVGALTHGFSHTRNVPTTLVPGACALGPPVLDFHLLECSSGQVREEVPWGCPQVALPSRPVSAETRFCCRDPSLCRTRERAPGTTGL